MAVEVESIATKKPVESLACEEPEARQYEEEEEEDGDTRKCQRTTRTRE